MSAACNFFLIEQINNTEPMPTRIWNTHDAIFGEPLSLGIPLIMVTGALNDFFCFHYFFHNMIYCDPNLSFCIGNAVHLPLSLLANIIQHVFQTEASASNFVSLFHNEQMFLWQKYCIDHQETWWLDGETARNTVQDCIMIKHCFQY